ncbi:glycosyltransferase family 2 protein [Winogradskyella sp. PAMC22761]|nr:glycosyltransferase family 2 protein [Winogradskyella sp. PAMC22761]
MPNQPLVSIIIPTYNRAHLIGETLDSVMAQTYQNWECTVVDDGSTDDTVQVIQDYCAKDSRFKHYNRPEDRPKGANACRNIGIYNSLGEYLIFLDSDDLLEMNCLKNRLKVSLECPDKDFYVFKMQKFKIAITDSNQIINKNPKNKEATYLEMFLSYELPWPITCLFVKKKNLDFGFDEKLQRFQDVLFSIMLLIRLDNFKVFDKSEPDCFYRITDGSLARVYDSDFIIKVLVSYKNLIIKIMDELRIYDAEEKYKDELFAGFMKIFHSFILPQKKYDQFLSISKILLKYKIISYYKLLILNILFIYRLLGVEKMKGLGYHRLNKILK